MHVHVDVEHVRCWMRSMYLRIYSKFKLKLMSFVIRITIIIIIIMAASYRIKNDHLEDQDQIILL